MAERGGFEPPVEFDPYDGLANRSFRPLRHLSADLPYTILHFSRFANRIPVFFSENGRILPSISLGTIVPPCFGRRPCRQYPSREAVSFLSAAEKTTYPRRMSCIFNQRAVY